MHAVSMAAQRRHAIFGVELKKAMALSRDEQFLFGAIIRRALVGSTSNLELAISWFQ